MTPFIFILLALSVWRVTHLVVEDTIPVIAKPREWLIDRNPDSSFSYLLGCTYCSSIWVAAAHVAIVDWILDYSVPVPVAVLFGLSILTAFGETVVEFLDGFSIRGDK